MNDSLAGRASSCVGYLADLIVSEEVASTRLAQQAAPQQLFDCRQAFGLTQAADSTQQFEVTPITEHGADGADGQRSLAQARQPGADQRRHLSRERAARRGARGGRVRRDGPRASLIPLEQAALRQGFQGLDEEERMPAGFVEQPLVEGLYRRWRKEQRGWLALCYRLRAYQRLDQPASVFARERGERHFGQRQVAADACRPV